MTDWEKAVVMAYTGICLLSGEKFGVFHRYVEEKLGRPVWTHELAGEAIAQQIKEAAKPDFLTICADEEQHFWPSPESAPNARRCGNCGHHIPYSDTSALSICGNVCSDYFDRITGNGDMCDEWREKA